MGRRWDGHLHQRRSRPLSSAVVGASESSQTQLTALRYFALDGTDHESHRGQARMTRRYIHM